MFNILRAITGLWSAPATKYVLGAVLTGSVVLWVHVSGLNNQIELQQVELAGKQLEIDSLSQSLVMAKQATQAALDEVESRDRMAVERLNKITELNQSLAQFKRAMATLERTDEQTKSWAEQPVPAAVISLLNNTRGQDHYRGEGAEGNATTHADAGLHYTSYEGDYQSRSGATDWSTLPGDRRLQF